MLPKKREKYIKLYEDLKQLKMCTSKKLQIVKKFYKDCEEISIPKSSINPNYEFKLGLMELLQHNKFIPASMFDVCYQQQSALYKHYLEDKNKSEVTKADVDLYELYDSLSYTGVLYQYFNTARYEHQKDSMFCVTNSVFKTFSNMPLPNISLEEIGFENLPALFLFEDNTAIKICREHIRRSDSKESYTVLSYIYYSKGSIATSSIEHSTNLNTLDETAQQSVSNIELQRLRACFNILSFSTAKNIKDVSYGDLNDKATKLEQQISRESNIHRIKQLDSKLKQMPRYHFLDLELTIQRITEKYQSSQKTDTTKTPHWRSAHWHSYWKKDKFGNKEKIWHYLPLIAVNGCSQDYDMFRVVK